MTKICEQPDCNVEISAWQSLCPTHYAQQVQAQQPQQQPQAQPPVQQQPEQTVEQPKQKQKPVTEVEEQLPKLPQRETAIIRQVCFKSAVDLIISLEDTSQKEFEQLLGEIQTLTDEFYAIIVRKL